MKRVKKQPQSNMIEPDKELKFGGVQKYSGGGYPVYPKGSKQSKSFQEAFGKAGKSGKSVFEWEGRKYGTRLAGESNDKYKARLARNSAGTTKTESKGPSQIASKAPTERGLATGPRPTLGSTPSKKSAAEKKEERSNKRKGNRAERQANPNRKQRKVMKSTSNAKTADKDAAVRTGAAGTKISTNTNPSSYYKKPSSGMSMSQLGGKEVDMSAMKSSGTSKSQSASKPASGRVGRLEERAKRARERNANRNRRQSSKSSRREAVKSAKANLKAARRG